MTKNQNAVRVCVCVQVDVRCDLDADGQCDVFHFGGSWILKGHQPWVIEQARVSVVTE